MAFYLSGVFQTREKTTQTALFYVNTWGDIQKWIDETGNIIVAMQPPQSTMDIKSAYAKESYRLNFRDKLNNISENYYVFSDDWRQISELINTMQGQGYTLNQLCIQDSELIAMVNR